MFIFIDVNYAYTKQLHILVQLAIADDNFADSEKEAIRTIGRSYEIPDDTIESIIESPNLHESLAPMPVVQRMEFLIDSMHVLLADKEINELEEEFIRTLSRNLGFNDQVITFLLDYHTMDREPLKNMMHKYLLRS